MSFSAELKRRKVFRVAAAYLVGAWVVLQVADILLPALELPLWTVKLVAILAIVGFPVALIIGWIFDLVPGGIERTADAATFRFPLRAALVGTLVVVIGVSGFMIIRRRLDAVGLDPNAVVVLPFRVTGDAQLQLMREGMVDLIVPKLTGMGGPRAVDSRTTLSAWRRAVRTDDADLAPIKAIGLARKLGAGHVILGEIVGAQGQIALNARIYSTIDGSASAPARVTARQDSILPAVDRMIAELLSRQAGEGDNLAALLTNSLEAVQAYLEGNRDYRLGNYEEASQRFAEAVDADSTFALAAFGESRSLGWTGFGPRYQRARKLAFTFRDRLPPRERDLLIAELGEDFPRTPSYAQTLRRWEYAVARQPDSPEAWYGLGDTYFHNGQPLGMADYADRALRAWARSIALDSSYAPPWEHQMQIHAARGDTARMRHVYQHLRSITSDHVSGTTKWVYAAAAGHDTVRGRLLREAREWHGTKINDAILHVMKSGIPAHDLDKLADIFVATASPVQRDNLWFWRAIYELNRGRTSRAQRALDEGAARDATRSQAQFVTVAHSIAYRELDQAVADRAAHDLRNDKQPFTICMVGFWNMFKDRRGLVEHALRAMADTLARRGSDADDIRHCRQMLVAGHAVIFHQPTARTELQRMDSSVVDGPIMGGPVANFSAVLLARLYSQTGDFERARQAALRGGYAQYHLSAQVLEHARAAAQAGQHAEAIESYRIFLLMQDPEPGPAKQLYDKARAELAMLTSR